MLTGIKIKYINDLEKPAKNEFTRKNRKIGRTIVSASFKCSIDFDFLNIRKDKTKSDDNVKVIIQL